MLPGRRYGNKGCQHCRDQRFITYRSLSVPTRARFFLLRHVEQLQHPLALLR